MHIPHVRRTLVVAALFAVAGCSGATSMPGSSTTPFQSTGAQSAGSRPFVPGQFVHRGVPFVGGLHRTSGGRSVGPAYKTKGVLLFEGDQTSAAIHIYKNKKLANNPAPFVTLTSGTGCPYGMAKDSQGTLYQANNCGVSTVQEFPKGQTSPTVTITNGISNPLGLAVDSSNTLYVSNYPAAITEYAFGTTSPSKTITGSGLTDPFGLALDASGNLFVADFGASQVFEIPAGSSTVTPLNLQSLTEPLGVAIDPTNGNLWVTDGQGKRVNVYAPGSTTPLQSITGYIFPYAISIDSAGEVVVSDLNGSAGKVYAYKPGSYTSYATLTNSIKVPTGLLLTKI